MVGRKKRKVGINARGPWIVVAGGKVDVALEGVLLAADDHQYFCVHLKVDQAVDYQHARALKLFGPSDVALLVKARL